MNHLRKLEESHFDWKVRLIASKIDKELDLDWVEIRDLLGLECSSDHLRKTAQGFYEAYNGLKDKFESTNPDDYLKEIQDQTTELQKEKIRFQDQKREYGNIVRQQARFEHLKEEVNKAISEIASYKPLKFNPPSPTLSKIKANVLWSDWHAGMDFSNSLNTYNLDVFKQRLEKLVSKTIEYGTKHNVDTLTIGGLGDFISGSIHVSTRVQSSEDVIKQVQIVSEAMSESLAEISKHFRKVRFINIIGNHARTQGNKAEAVLKENFEYLIPWYMESRLKDFSNIELFKDQDGYFVDTTFTPNQVYVHGDLDHVSSVAKTLPQIIGIIPSYIYCGHIHHDTVKEFGRTKVISNGSMIGTDDYSISKRLFAEPMQKMHIFNDQDKIEYTIYINLN